MYDHKPGYIPGDRVLGAEDCLYLNIYVPEIDDHSEQLPVIFWIYGGAFTHGSADMYGAKYIMDKNVILVTFNYRVGPLGNVYFFFFFSFNAVVLLNFIIIIKMILLLQGF